MCSGWAGVIVILQMRKLRWKSYPQTVNNKVPALGAKFQSLYFHNLPSMKTINLFSLLPHRWYCRLFRVPWTARTSNQSILKEIIPEYSLEGLILKLKLQYFGHLIWRTDSFEKTLMLGKIAGRKRREQQRMRWLDGITNSIDMSLGVGDGQGGLACCSPWGHKDSDTTEWLNWTELNWTSQIPSGQFILCIFRQYFNQRGVDIKRTLKYTGPLTYSYGW